MMVSDDEIVMRIMGVLANADLTTTTTAAIQRQLEEDLGTDLTEKKAFIREQVGLYLQAQQHQHQHQHQHQQQQQQQQQPFLQAHYYAANYAPLQVVEEEAEIDDDNAVQPEPEREPKRSKAERAKKDGKLYGDKVVLRGVKFMGIHGVNEEEKLVSQPFIIDLDAWLNMKQAGETDNLYDTVSYTDLHRLIKEVVEGPHFNLVEALANTIATTIFSTFPSITHVRVRIGKPKVAAKKDAEYVGVEIFRTMPTQEGNKEHKVIYGL